MSQIAGATILITGGGSGMGRLLALGMTRLGGRVVIWDLNEGAMKSVVKECEDIRAGSATGYVVDVTDREVVYAVSEQVRDEVGDIDILVNNAGIVSGRPLLDIPDEKIQKTYEVNTLALYWTTKAFLPAMVSRNRGHVVTIASAAGLVGTAKQTDYAGSKFAAVGFDESLRNELRKTAPGVRTTIVCPYYVDTGMFAGVKTKFPALLPILKEKDMARDIVDGILRDKARVIKPPFVYAGMMSRWLPVAAFDWMMDFFGINSTMDEFVGREG